MNLLAVFGALIQLGVCQPAALQDQDGKRVDAIVCPMADIQAAQGADDSKDPASDSREPDPVPGMPKQHRT